MPYTPTQVEKCPVCGCEVSTKEGIFAPHGFEGEDLCECSGKFVEKEEKRKVA